MDHLASMYIDDELDLDEKVVFIDQIHNEALFFQDTRALLLQEKVLRTAPDTTMLPASPPAVDRRHHWLRQIRRPLAYAAAGFVAAMLLLFHLSHPTDTPSCFNRFVIYKPYAQRVELAGSFTGWQRTPLTPIGKSGYWELNYPVPIGEHRFAYIIDGSHQEADPTLPVREHDDFGGENSILTVEQRV